MQEAKIVSSSLEVAVDGPFTVFLSRGPVVTKSETEGSVLHCACATEKSANEATRYLLTKLSLFICLSLKLIM